MICVKNESKATNFKELEYKGDHNKIVLCQYDRDNDGVMRYSVVDNSKRKLLKTSNNYEEAKKYFDGIRTRRSSNDIYLGENAYHIVCQALDTYGYKYWDCDTKEDLKYVEDLEGLTKREFENIESTISRANPNECFRLSSKQRKALVNIIQELIDRDEESDSYFKDLFNKETWMELKTLFPDLYCETH